MTNPEQIMVLVINSGNTLKQPIVQCLTKHCFLHDVVSNYDSALSLLAARHYDLIIVEATGTASCKDNVERIARQCPDSWLMVVKRPDHRVDGIDYFEIGADDYISNVFDERLFIARVKAYMRRCIPVEKRSERIDIGPVSIDERYHTVKVHGQTVLLTAREFSLFTFLCRHPNQVFSRTQLLSSVWGYNHEGYEHTVNTHVNRLRAKLDEVASIENAGQLIQTVWGVGYRMSASGYVAKAVLV
jgi:two-component system response regulator ResD